MNEEELQLYKYLNGLISYPFTRDSRNKILEMFSDVLKLNEAYENMRIELIKEFNFYETTEWGIKGYEILEKFRNILNKVGGSDE